MSSNFQMFVQVLLKFIAFPVLYLSLLKTENIKENGGLKRSRTLCSPRPWPCPLPAFHLWKTLV